MWRPSVSITTRGIEASWYSALLAIGYAELGLRALAKKRKVKPAKGPLDHRVSLRRSPHGTAKSVASIWVVSSIET
jgi:hypothetical protein